MYPIKHQYQIPPYGPSRYTSLDIFTMNAIQYARSQIFTQARIWYPPLAVRKNPDSLRLGIEWVRVYVLVVRDTHAELFSLVMKSDIPANITA